LQLTLDPTSYSWRFVPAAGSTYSDAGSAACSDTPPSAVLAVSSTTATVGQAVLFDATGSQDPDGTISQQRIDFGDGASTTAATAVHAYSAPGQYIARLLVTDNGGQTAAATQTIQVVSAPPRRAQVRLKLVLAPQALAHALRYGLGVTVTPSQPGRLDIAALFERRVAQRVGLARGRRGHEITVAATHRRALRRRAEVRLVFTHAARDRLAHLDRVSLTLLATFIATNRTSVKRSSKVTLTKLR
jgi:PKD repeat protein